MYKEIHVKDWLISSRGLASLKSVGQASGLETQAGLDVALEVEFLPLWETTVFPLKLDLQLIA